MRRRAGAIGMFGIVWICLACGGAENQAQTPPTVEPEAAEPAAEPEAAEPEAAEPAAEAEAAEPAAAGETPAPPAGGEESAEAAPTAEEAGKAAPASSFKGKGPEQATLGQPDYKKSPVPFDHWKHQEQGVKCGRCHHYGMKSCGGGDCHKRFEKMAPARKTAVHGRCMPCHKKEKVHKGCTDCHVENG